MKIKMNHIKQQETSRKSCQNSKSAACASKAYRLLAFLVCMSSLKSVMAQEEPPIIQTNCYF